MKQSTVSISFDTEKIAATKRYMKKKDADLETELAAQLERMYEKHVPASVREYINESAAKDADDPAPRIADKLDGRMRHSNTQSSQQTI